MEDNAKSLIFKARVSNIQQALKALRKHEIIGDKTHTDYWLRTLTLRTSEEIEDLVHEVAGLCIGVKIQKGGFS